MTLADGYHDVPLGKVAAVVTFLEMRRKPTLKPATLPTGVTLERWPAPDPEGYRALFRRVGGPWLWFSRLQLQDRQLTDILADPAVQLWTLRRDGAHLGILELDFREPGACELAYFGLDQSLIGTGSGRALMNAAIDTAWQEPISRFHVHTCTLDSPQALPFYVRSGFTPISQKIEIAPDPRLSGLYDAASAPQIPVIRPE